MKIFSLIKDQLISSRKKFIPYGKQNITRNDIKSVIKVLKSDYLTQGENIGLFEKALAKRVNAKFGIAVNSATSALHIACLSLGLKENDYLWTTPISFVASANCGRYCGANVDFVDINPDTGLMSISELKQKLEKAAKENSLPKIVIPVHLAGSSCNMKEVYELSKKYNFKIIEDASHALGGKYESEPVGSCKYSDITIFSFHPVKIITTAEGGMAVTNNKSHAQKMMDLRSHCIVKDKERFIEKTPGDWRYEMQSLGFNYRMNEIQAALGLSQLKRLNYIVEKRNNLYLRYKFLLKDLPLELIKIPNNTYSSIHLAIIRLKNKSLHREVFSKLRENGIGVQLHYQPIHLQPYYKKQGFQKGDFPISEDFAESCFSIPLYPELTNFDLQRICKALKNLLNYE